MPSQNVDSDRPTAKPKLTDVERHKRFVETAKKVGAAENMDQFDRNFSALKIKQPKRTEADRQQDDA
jgi:hypothetical protein